MLSLLLLLACNREERLPDNVLPPDRMAPLLKQVIAADEWVNWRVEHQEPMDVYAERIHRYRAAFHAQGVTEQQFRTSFAYYKAHPVMLRTMLDTLLRQPNIDTTVAPVGKYRKPAKPMPVD